jgi:rubrerythrin
VVNWRKIINTIRDLIHWQYAKIIAESAGAGKRNWGFVMSKYEKLQRGEIFWNMIREYVKERECRDVCIFCGAHGSLTLEHLFPRSLNGPEDEKNVVWICRSCNSMKGARRLYEAWTLKKGLKGAKYDIPRIAEGKYLKLIYQELENKGMLNINREELEKKICPICEMEESAGKLSPLCLDGAATLCFY